MLQGGSDKIVLIIKLRNKFKETSTDTHCRMQSCRSFLSLFNNVPTCSSVFSLAKKIISLQFFCVMLRMQNPSDKYKEFRFSEIELFFFVIKNLSPYLFFLRSTLGFCSSCSIYQISLSTALIRAAKFRSSLRDAINILSSRLRSFLLQVGLVICSVMALFNCSCWSTFSFETVSKFVLATCRPEKI